MSSDCSKVKNFSFSGLAITMNVSPFIALYIVACVVWIALVIVVIYWSGFTLS